MIGKLQIYSHISDHLLSKYVMFHMEQSEKGGKKVATIDRQIFTCICLHISMYLNLKLHVYQYSTFETRSEFSLKIKPTPKI